MTTLKTISEKVNAWRRYREAVRELPSSPTVSSTTSASAAATSRLVRRSVMKEAA